VGTYPPVKMEQTECFETLVFSTPVILHTYPPMKMEHTECSETLAITFRRRGITQKKAYNQIYFLFHHVQTVSGFHPASYAKSTVGKT